ncbi:MAG: GTP-binding protein [candidate division NC10 bacterium]|nr:GTP-binding protein [candidate division NC10 bacterium]
MEKSQKEIEFHPRTIEGIVLEASTGKPIPKARVMAGGQVVLTGREGIFQLKDTSPDAAITVKAPGYAPLGVVVGEESRLQVRLRPFYVKGLYLTFFGTGDREIRGRVLDLLENTELNAVIIDVKGDRGWIAYKSTIPLAQEIGATAVTTMRDPEGLLAYLKERGIYTIARVVVFKDNVLARSRPDLAVIDSRTGRPWIDREGLAWTDPFKEEVWEYNLAIAQEAARKGFDEIQFDYLRFPSDGHLRSITLSRPNTMEERLQAIGGFLARAQPKLLPMGVFIAADIFGYTNWRTDDTGIGQRIEEVAQYVDFLSPMVYPSSYHAGIPGFRFSVAYPYEIVFLSLKRAVERLQDNPIKIRPWLQDFRDYGFDGRLYSAKEVLAQMKAAQDAGAWGWMLWNPRVRYTREALAPKPSPQAPSPREARNKGARDY